MATITEIKAEQLRRPDTPEGLILQGCGKIFCWTGAGLNRLPFLNIRA